MNEWLLIDKTGDFFYYYKIEEIAKYLDLTKSQVNNIIIQSLKHYNKYTNRGYYIQRLYNNAEKPPKEINKENFDKYIYYINNHGEKEYGQEWRF